MKHVRKWFKKASWLIVALILSLAMTAMVGCSAEGVEDVLDIAIDVLDALETEEGGGNALSDQSQKTGNSIQTSDDSLQNAASGDSETLSGDKQEDPMVEEDGWYRTKDEVALYIYLYGELPDNFITKNEARDLGWESSEGNLWEVADGMSIGGDRYYNSDEQLPEIKGRKYYECDINYNGGFRGAERIVYSNDGLIYYTGDHYESFECLYGEE